MGVSTDAILCYGVDFEEDYIFPWDKSEYEGDEEEWWMSEVLKYQPPYEVFDDMGDYLPGFDTGSPKVSAFFDHRRKAIKTNPFPVEIVYHCSDPMVMAIVAAKGSVVRASRGHPEEIKELLFGDSEALALFLQEHFGIEKPNPRWFLSSWWG